MAKSKTHTGRDQSCEHRRLCVQLVAAVHYDHVRVGRCTGTGGFCWGGGLRRSVKFKVAVGHKLR